MCRSTPEPHPIPEKDKDDSGTRVEKDKESVPRLLWLSGPWSMKQVSIFYPISKMAWWDRSHPVWNGTITKSYRPGHSLLQLEGAGAEALWRNGWYGRQARGPRCHRRHSSEETHSSTTIHFQLRSRDLPLNHEPPWKPACQRQHST